MSKFLSSRLSALKEYTPGEQPRDMEYIKLNTNESPFPPSNEVIRAVTEGRAKNLQLYSDPECTELTQKLADYYGVKKENVILGNGSDEILNFCFCAYFDSENPVIFPDITYGFYKVFAQLYNSRFTEIPLTNTLEINPVDYIGVNKHIVIANPNAPTGIALTLETIEKILSSNPNNIVVIDEAYIDFGGESAVPLTKKYSNLLVCMTFSKSRSLAGARLGFAIGDKSLIADLNKIKYSTNPYNINSLTQAAGIAVINEQEYYDRNVLTVIENRKFFCNELDRIGFSYLPSSANFVFVKKEGLDGEKLYLTLKQNGILVRHFKNPRICDYIRVTVGAKKDMESLISVLERITE